MDQFEQAHHELSRIQEIIARHEEHIFALRGWMLTLLGGLLAAYYTGNIHLNLLALQIALPTISLLFLWIEVRHSNVVESVVDRAEAVEKQVSRAHSPTLKDTVWYDGPCVSEACRTGAERVFPQVKMMTFVVNRTFYVVVILISVILAIALPPK
jgi:hypothetical protein